MRNSLLFVGLLLSGCNRYGVTVSDFGKPTEEYPLCGGPMRMEEGKKYMLMRRPPQQCWIVVNVLEATDAR